jgi:sulfide:quinone oxidoreductase
MKTRVVILGAGTGGTLTANRLRASDRGDQLEITVVDQDTRHVYQPGLLFVPFGLTTADDIVRPRQQQLHSGIDFIQSPVDHVDITAKTVTLDDARMLP